MLLCVCTTCRRCSVLPGDYKWLAFHQSWLNRSQGSHSVTPSRTDWETAALHQYNYVAVRAEEHHLCAAHRRQLCTQDWGFNTEKSLKVREKNCHTNSSSFYSWRQKQDDVIQHCNYATVTLGNHYNCHGMCSDLTISSKWLLKTGTRSVTCVQRDYHTSGGWLNGSKMQSAIRLYWIGSFGSYKVFCHLLLSLLHRNSQFPVIFSVQAEPHKYEKEIPSQGCCTTNFWATSGLVQLWGYHPIFTSVWPIHQ